MQQTTATISDRVIEWSASDSGFMQRALELAELGTGRVSPGPMVGCVIVSNEGEVVGEGFYIFDKLKHAETYALEQAGQRARGATAFVSLEPHAHHGRTPPCTNALIDAGIRRVVSPIEDPNPEVSGKGFAHLSAAGVQVEIGLLEREARQLNEKYCHFMVTGRPFVHLKLATSLDGKIATATGESQWITGVAARARVHELRHEHDAILVGARTASLDDPLLTDRSGKTRGKPIVRVILDRNLTISPQSRLATTAAESPVLVFTGENNAADKIAALQRAGVEILSEQKPLDLLSVLTSLGQRSIQSVLVEGGATVAGNLLDAGLVNKLSLFLAPIIIGGRDAPSAIGGQGAQQLIDAWKLDNVTITHHGEDIEITGYPNARRGELR